jgi:hypothetical protein
MTYRLRQGGPDRKALLAVPRLRVNRPDEGLA